MTLEMQHAKIVAKIAIKEPEKAKKVTTGEVLRVIKESSSFEDFENRFTLLINSL